MLHHQLVSFAALVVSTKSQVVFPNSSTKPISSIKNHEVCTASNGQPGLCYEYRSNEFKGCSNIPSIDTSDPEVADHLEKNTCNNTGKEIFFCCSLVSSQLEAALPKETECGISFRKNVVGGTLTDEGDWPWLASIGNTNSGAYESCCGGTLITKQHVISAAHCFTPKNRENCLTQFVRLGEHDINKDDDGAQDYDISDKMVHEYDSVTGQNDIILLKLDRPINSFIDRIRPACLPYHLRNEKFKQKDLIVVGWGRFDNSQVQGSPVPIEGTVPVVPISECQAQYQATPTLRKIDDKQLCAGTGGTDSCHGDSGGPLNYLDPIKERFYVVGAVSFGPRHCGINNHPGVYARIGYYLDWIEENLVKLL